ncbi:MAG: hypothetical protein JSV82_04575 [Planctomycetota bacterium]|nr:MAG: hypothetical protein JSV82_04575 [Planctomycetota bacterium]
MLSIPISVAVIQAATLFFIRFDSDKSIGGYEVAGENMSSDGNFYVF